MTLRLLLVDDNAQFLDAASGLLEREGISVVGVATSGAEALERIEELDPDLALVDVDLGVESGLELVERLARRPVRPGGRPPRYILISAYAEQDVVDLVAATPALGFVSKAELSRSAIEQVLAPRRANRLSGPQGS
jgi:CheY-like chemotaxis protein